MNRPEPTDLSIFIAQKIELYKEKNPLHALVCAIPNSDCGRRKRQRFEFRSIVVLATEVRYQIFTAKMAQGVLELHQLNKDVVLRVQVGRGLGRFEVEG